MPKRTPNVSARDRKRIIAALVSHRTIREAAESLGVSRDSIYMYIRDHPEAQEEWYAACCQAVEQACAILASSSVDAAEMLVDSIKTKQPLSANMLRTLEVVLDRATEYMRMRGLQSQLDALKRQLAERESLTNGDANSGPA